MTVSHARAGADVRRALQVLSHLRRTVVVCQGELTTLYGWSDDGIASVLESLVDEGYLAPADGENCFRAGPVLIDLSRVVRTSSRVLDIARPTLIQLAHESGETAQLGLFQEESIRIADAVESTQMLRVGGSVGERAGPDSCLGAALVAGTAEVPRSLAAPGPVRRAAECGFASTFDARRETGVCAVAVAVPGAPAAIGLLAPMSRMDVAQHTRQIAMLKAAASRLAEALTGRSDSA